MSDKMGVPELKEGLKCCAVHGGRCGYCPYQHAGGGIECTTTLAKDALLYIGILEDSVNKLSERRDKNAQE